MSLELGLVIEISLLLLAFLIVIIYSVSIVKSKEDNDYNEFIQEYQEQKIQVQNDLKKGNKYINEIEREILECKKKLHMKLFKTK